MNLDDMCYKVCKAAKRTQDEQQLKTLRRWMWDFSMHVTLRIAQASFTAMLCSAASELYALITLGPDQQPPGCGVKHYLDSRNASCIGMQLALV